MKNDVGSQTERRRVIVAHQFSLEFDTLMLMPPCIISSTKKGVKMKWKKKLFLKFQIPQNKTPASSIVYRHDTWSSRSLMKTSKNRATHVSQTLHFLGFVFKKFLRKMKDTLHSFWSIIRPIKAHFTFHCVRKYKLWMFKPQVGLFRVCHTVKNWCEKWTSGWSDLLFSKFL